MSNNILKIQAQWHMPVIPILGRQKHKDQEFKVQGKFGLHKTLSQARKKTKPKKNQIKL